MIWRSVQLLASLLLLAGLSPAKAQSLVSHSQLIDELGDCLVKREPKLTQALLRAPTVQQAPIMKVLVKRASACMKNSRLRFSESLFVSTLAGATLRAMPDLSIAARALRIVPPQRIDARLDNTGLLIALAACVAGAEPAGAAEFVAKPFASIDANMSAQLIGSALQGCMPENLELRLGLPDLRLALSSALYQRLLPPDAAQE